MFKAFFKTKKWAAWAYGGGATLLISLWAQVQMSVMINSWYKGFYDLLQNASERELSEFWTVMIAFCWIALPYVLLGTATSYLVRLYAFRWREAITFDYIPQWIAAHDVKIEGASQRIQEDTGKFAGIVESLGLQLPRGIMTLIAFIPILWAMSEEHMTFGPFADLPGSLVWLCILISVGGMTVSWFVGWWLPGLEYNNQKVEASFRKELVYGEDDRINYASMATLTELFTGIKYNYHKLFLHYGYFDIWLNTYGQMMVILPYAIVAPGLFVAGMSLGTMTMITNAFGQVRDSLMILIHNWTRITELRSVWKRLTEFQRSLIIATSDK